MAGQICYPAARPAWNLRIEATVNHVNGCCAAPGLTGTGYVGESVDKSLAAKALPAGQLDKAERGIIDHAACLQCLDSGAVQNHLRDLGFSAALEGLRRGPAAAKEPFRRPALVRAEEGLLHVMGVLRERDEVREGFDVGTRAGGDRQDVPACSRNGASMELRRPMSRAFGSILRADRTSESRKSTEEPDRNAPFGIFDREPTTGGLANA